MRSCKQEFLQQNTTRVYRPASYRISNWRRACRKHNSDDENRLVVKMRS